MRFVVAAALAFSLSGALVSPSLSAQSPADTGQQGPHEKLFTGRDGLIALGFTGLTIAMFPIDKSAALRLQRDRVQNRRLYNRTATAFRLLGAPVSLFTAVGLYGAGRITGHRGIAGAGLHITESMVLAGTITQAGKGLAGRARPRAFKDTLGVLPFEPDPLDFKLNRGWGKGEFQSFPSGHTTAAFAFASAFVSEVHRYKPGYTWWVGPIFYGGATLVGASRMYNNAHWASDVALGAAIGTFSGLKVVRYNRVHPSNKLDRFFLGRSEAGESQFKVTRLGWSMKW